MLRREKNCLIIYMISFINFTKTLQISLIIIKFSDHLIIGLHILHARKMYFEKKVSAIGSFYKHQKHLTKR